MSSTEGHAFTRANKTMHHNALLSGVRRTSTKDIRLPHAKRKSRHQTWVVSRPPNSAVVSLTRVTYL